MPDIPDKVTFRVGDLSGPLGDYCDQHEVTPSQAIREALSLMLGVDEPKMRVGNPTFGSEK